MLPKLTSISQKLSYSISLVDLFNAIAAREFLSIKLQFPRMAFEGEPC
ncbi:hypothetical protein HC931_02695 [Candidatus Gracilibacteria bacterium]|jgi:hypothetical protein|nr:hypothetical protein [Candidatus Gracilibacteria bacterium]NJM88010.1 hypothetical protein [Hydrococcus sp. RU_2_2]NJP18388.1 hypothetical protein [Hydrococcus sp. CRU_1_1]NJQ97651.1 hypothetical protein [Hydrococcus sp. CSU_1_8]